MEFLVVFFLCLLLVLLPLLKLLLLPGKRLPPSPWGLPLIGHLHLLGRAPHRSLQELSKKFGDLMFLRFGMVPAIVVSCPEIAKEVLKTHDATFSSRPYLQSGEFATYNFKGVALSAGDHWKKVRKFCTTELFAVRRLDTFWNLQVEEVSSTIASLIRQEQNVINVREVLVPMSFNIITQIVMGKRYFGEHATEDTIKEAKVFKAVMDETTLLALQFHISEFVPSWLRWIDWSRVRARRLLAKQTKFLQNIIDEHKNNQNPRTTLDFLDTLLQLTDDEDVVKALILEVITGGSDASSCTVEWALLELLNNPDIMRKAQEELDAVVEPNRMVLEADFAKLPYLAAVVKETLRLHAPAPILVPRMSNQACVVAGYNIPKGATAIVNFYAIVRDPRFWEKPDKFWPERFQGLSVDFRGHDFELIPFGAGRRMCPGMALGLKNVYLTLANLLHTFTWSCVPGRSYGLEDEFAVMTWPKTPLHVKVTPRQAI